MKFAKPIVVDGSSLTFGRIERLLPAYKEIPEEFRCHNGTKWNDIFSTWFFSGLPKETKFFPKQDIDLDAALKHLKTILRSWEPKHEHKEAGCAYLMSLWFEDVVIPNKTN